MPVKITHFIYAFLPLALAPVFFFALAEGWINLGGGEKDILIVLPYTLWALIFFVSSVILIIKRRTLKQWAGRATSLALLVLIILAACLYSFDWLGVL